MTKFEDKIKELTKQHSLSDKAQLVLQLHAAEPTAIMFYDRNYGNKTVKRDALNTLKAAYAELANAGLIESAGAVLRVVCEGQDGVAIGESVSLYRLTRDIRDFIDS